MDSARGSWDCPRCTLKNKKGKKKCSACDWPRNRRVVPPPCVSCSLQESGSKETWQCPRCTLINNNVKSQCEACNCKRPERPVMSTATGTKENKEPSIGSLKYGSDFDGFLSSPPKLFGAQDCVKTDYCMKRLSKDLNDVGGNVEKCLKENYKRERRTGAKEKRKQKVHFDKRDDYELSVSVNTSFDSPSPLYEGWVCRTCKTCNTGGKCFKCNGVRPRGFRQRNVSKLVQKMEQTIRQIQHRREEANKRLIHAALKEYIQGSEEFQAAQVALPLRKTEKHLTRISAIDWNCAWCTYQNKKEDLKCKICLGNKLSS